MATKNYYDILGIEPTATEGQIRKSYLQRTKVIHPDRFNQHTQAVEWKIANEMLKELNYVYNILCDPISRAQYDKSLSHDNRFWTKPAKSHYSESQTEGTPPSPTMLSSGYILFSELSRSIQIKMLERQSGKNKVQYQIKISGIFLNYFFLILSCGWFWMLFLFANDSHWTSEYVYWIIGITIFACGLVGVSVNKIVKWHKAKLKCYLYITPLYIIKTKLDQIWYWPIPEIQNIHVARTYKNKIYQSTSIRFQFLNTREEVTISDNANVDLFLANLRGFNRKFRSALAQQNWLFFLKNNDFREIVPIKSKSKNGKKGISPIAACTLVVPFLIGGISLYTAYNINTQKPSLVGLPPQKTIPLVSNFDVNSYKSPNVRFDKTPQPLPKSGDGIVYFQKIEAVAPLTIVTKTSKLHYFVKIIDWYTNQVITTFFICSGQQVSMQLPLGSYKIKYATGQIWYGDKYLFGPNTDYSEVDKKLAFEKIDDRVTGYTIELFLQQNGNLHTKKISPNNW